MRFVFATLLLSLPLLAAADEWKLVDSFLSADFLPGSATQPNADGFWALGTSDGIAALVRYNTDGSVKFLRYPYMPNLQFDGAFKLTSMTDGGVASTDVEETDQLGYPACKLRRYDSDGNLLWTSNLAQPTGVLGGNLCSDIATDGANGIWLFPAGLNQNYVILVNPDGSQGAQIERPGSTGSRFSADPLHAAVYIAGGTPINDTTNLATVWKVTAQGVEWSSSAPAADAGSMLDDVTVANDGSLWAFGRKASQLYGMHVAANGIRLWSGAFATTVIPTHVKVVARADGSVNTLHWDGTLYDSAQPSSIPELSRFSTVGTRLWHVPAAGAPPTAQAQLDRLSIAAAVNGDAVAAWTYYGGGQPDTNYYLQQTRVDANGSSLFTVLAPNVPTKNGAEIVSFPDSSSLTVTSAFAHLARNGDVLTPPATSAITTTTSYNDNEIMAPDGTAYLLVQNPAEKHYGLSAYSNSGALRWHTSIASNWDNDGFVGSQMLLRKNDICVAAFLDGDEMIQCFALIDGHPAPKLILASSLSTSSSRIQASVTKSDQLVVLYLSPSGAPHHALIDESGNLLHDVVALQSGENWGASAESLQGDAFVVTSNSSLLKLDVNGSRVFSVPTDLSFGRVVPAPDGGAILFAYDRYASLPVQVERVDASGQRLWSSTMPSGSFNRAISPTFNANDVYFALTKSGPIFNNGGPLPMMDDLLVKLAMNDGTVEWSSPVPQVVGHPPRIVMDPNSPNLLTFSSWGTFTVSSSGNATEVRKYATPDGALLVSKIEPCHVDQCVLFDAMMASDGTLRMVHDTTDYYSGSLFELTTMQNEIDMIFENGFE